MLNREKLQFYADKGYSRTRAAKEIGCVHQTVIDYAKLYGIEFRKYKQKILGELREKIIIDLENGMKQAAICRKHNAKSWVVSRVNKDLRGLESISRSTFVPPVKVRSFDLKVGDEFEVQRTLERKKYKVKFKIIQITDDLIIGRTSKGLVESFQIKEYIYGLM